MSDQTKIEWADSTFNPWIGCTKVSPACDHCYAENMMDTRFGRVKWGAGNPRSRTSAANWREPVRWDGLTFVQCQCGWRGELLAAKNGVCPSCAEVDQFTSARRRVFCASLADVFDNEVPDAWRVDLFGLIRSTPNLDWLLLTKRIGNAVKMLDDAGGWSGFDFATGATRNPLPNVWIGATICDQEEADRDIPKLLTTPAAVRFVSIEPMLGPVDLRLIEVPPEHDQLRRPWESEGFKFNALQGHDDDRFHQAPATLDWVICGGESGPNARPMHPDWARSLRDQCEVAGVPFLFKQWGEWAPWDGDCYELPAGCDDTIADERATHPFGRDLPFLCVGKHAAGRTLDGRTHDGFPS